MRFELRGHHVDVTPGLRSFVEEKLSKLERLLNDRAVSAHAILTVEKRRHVADITLHARGERFLHGLGDSGNWETSLTQAIAKISHQAQKLKTRQKEKRHGLKAPSLEPLEWWPSAPRRASRPAARRRLARAGGCRVSCAPRANRSSRCRSKTRPGKSTPAATASSCSATPTRRRSACCTGGPNGELTLVETEA